MPLLYIDLIEGRTPAEVQALLDAIHDAVVEAFGVPPRDRYQVVHTHPAHEIVAWDTGLGIDRSSRLVVVHVVSRRRTREMKEKFYELLASNLADAVRAGPGRPDRLDHRKRRRGLVFRPRPGTVPHRRAEVSLQEPDIPEYPSHRILRHRTPDPARADGR